MSYVTDGLLRPFLHHRKIIPGKTPTFINCRMIQLTPVLSNGRAEYGERNVLTKVQNAPFYMVIPSGMFAFLCTKTRGMVPQLPNKVKIGNFIMALRSLLQRKQDEEPLSGPTP